MLSCESRYLFLNFCVIFSSKNNFPRTLFNIFISGIIRIQKILYLEVLTSALLTICVFFILHCDLLGRVRMGHFGPVYFPLINFLETPMECGRKFVGHNMCFILPT